MPNCYKFLKCMDPDCPNRHGHVKVKPNHIRSDKYKVGGHKDCKEPVACDCAICFLKFKAPAPLTKDQKNPPKIQNERAYLVT